MPLGVLEVVVDDVNDWLQASESVVLGEGPLLEGDTVIDALPETDTLRERLLKELVMSFV